jgi:hypothetical protein
MEQHVNVLMILKKLRYWYFYGMTSCTFQSSLLNILWSQHFCNENPAHNFVCRCHIFRLLKCIIIFI